MANGSKGERKQAEPEGKRTSQVRLWWEPMEGQRWVVTLPTLTLSVNPIDGGLQWSALVEVPNGADLCEYFATHEEAKQYCVEKARELLEKDLKSLGGGGNAAIPSITVPVRRTRTPGVIRLKLGEFDLKQADGSERTGKMFLHSSGSSLILQMPSGDEFTLGLGAVVESLAALPAVSSAPSVNETNSSAAN